MHLSAAKSTHGRRVAVEAQADRGVVWPIFAAVLPQSVSRTPVFGWHSR